MAQVTNANLTLPYAFRKLWKPARYKAFYGGRGAAKSHSFASALIDMASRRKMRILCCREIQRSIGASVKQLLDDKIAAGGLGEFYESTQYGITGDNGTQFLFAGLRTNPESVKSMEGIDVAWVEEANTVSQRSLDLLIPTIRKPNSEIWFGWNRRFINDPVDNMFLGGLPPPNSIIKKVNHNDNPWFPEVLQAEMAWDKERDLDKWRHVWEGEPIIRSEAKVFQNWRVEDIDHLLPPDCTPRLGADWGFAIDPTVLIECYIFDRTLYFRREAWKVRCEIDETPSLFAGSDNRQTPRWVNTHGHPGLKTARDGHRIVADSARPETISYMVKRGLNVVKARKGAGSIMDGIEFMKTYDIVIHPDCIHIIDEFATYSFKEDPLTDEILPILVDKKNHTIDAARYAVESARRRDGGRVAMVAPQTIQLNY